MKKIILCFTLTICMFSAIAQPQSANTINPFPKTISVNGSAEMEIIPDEIYVHITLREYQKKGETKKEIEILKEEFLANCRAVGIPDSLISVYSYSGYNSYLSYKKRKKDPNLMTSITYQVKFNSTELMDLLVEKIDDEATLSFTIASTSHSKLSAFRKQLKIQAIKAAKEKANYLADAVGEKIGETVTISEPDETLAINSYQNSNLAVRGTNGVYKFDSYQPGGAQLVEFKKIKLRFEINAIFSLR